MIIIDQILVSDELLDEHFQCNLEACRGACCYEGDFGAPLLEEERSTLDEIVPVLKPFLSAESQQKLDHQGPYRYYRGMQSWGTSLLDDGACVFMQKDPKGWAYCAIEKAHQNGLVPFQKPVSCHLYPVRVKENRNQGFIAVNYDRWEICSGGCALGQELKMPLYKFVKSALIRRFGQAFYEQLDALNLELKAKTLDEND